MSLFEMKILNCNLFFLAEVYVTGEARSCNLLAAALYLARSGMSVEIIILLTFPYGENMWTYHIWQTLLEFLTEILEW